MKALLFFLVLSICITACKSHQKKARTVSGSGQQDSTLQQHVRYWDSAYRTAGDPEEKTFIQPDDWQESFGLSHDPQKDSVWNQPVAYYISDRKCARLAIDFYYGRLRPADNATTDSLLAMATTGNDKLRPLRHPE